MRRHMLSLLALAALQACGGGDAPSPRELAQARADVSVAQWPERQACLQRLDSALQAEPTQRAVGLQCLAGTYRGLTPAGEHCALEVDAASGRFAFTHAGRTVSIDWDDVAHGSDGRAVHNLERAGLGPQSPGVTLTRYRAAPEAITETLALRHGSRGLPSMNYLRVLRGETHQVQCRFGA